MDHDAPTDIQSGVKPPHSKTRGSKVRHKLRIAYDGRPFDGWQSQPSRNAVQDHIEAALALIAGTRVVLQGSGRTDAGVHALGQIAHADLPEELTPAKWTEALNGNLPAEIRVLRTSRVNKDFHARFDATGKHYRYRIWNAPAMHPLELGRAWHFPWSLDPDLLHTALSHFVGTHDFRSFSASRGTETPDTTRAVHSARATCTGSLWTLDFEGAGFLYKMVRMLTATALRISCGRTPLSRIEDLLATPRTGAARDCAPAEGLYLIRVRYGSGSDAGADFAPAGEPA